LGVFVAFSGFFYTFLGIGICGHIYGTLLCLVLCSGLMKKPWIGLDFCCGKNGMTGEDAIPKWIQAIMSKSPYVRQIPFGIRGRSI
jgi:hypothetical protein